MHSTVRAVRGGILVLAAFSAVRCASTSSKGNSASEAAATPYSASAEATRASEEFALGREAALAGDSVCARFRFQQALDAVRPPGGPASSGSALAFQLELYEGIQRYEALAGATEEAGTSHGEVSPEFAAIESPRTSEEAISQAREAVASEMFAVASDVPLEINEAVLRVLAAFQGPELHDKIEAGLVRSGRYLPMIERIFAEEGLPKDLAWIAFIESSFLPHARSPKMAHGIWQFMPRTGAHYGLRVNTVVDERSDPEKATRSAARYLSYLHDLFGDWYLAMAGYNAGEGKILRAMQRTGAGDFWELASTSAIRRQTANYVPAFIASVLISKNPTHYGFDATPEPPLDYETVSLDRSVHLRHIAEGASLDLEALQSLNPELRTAITPHQPEGYELKIPAGVREPVLLAFAGAPTARPPSFRQHVARRGETLSRIAKRYGIRVSALATANGLSTRSKVRPGQELVVPERVASVASKKTKKASASTRVASAEKKAPAPGTHRSYRVKSGDTLYRIALRHGVTVAEILAINGLGGSAIRAGDRLKIPTKSR